MIRFYIVHLKGFSKHKFYVFADRFVEHQFRSASNCFFIDFFQGDLFVTRVYKPFVKSIEVSHFYISEVLS